jgi:hypothetical protein
MKLLVGVCVGRLATERERLRYETISRFVLFFPWHGLVEALEGLEKGEHYRFVIELATVLVEALDREKGGRQGGPSIAS